jgi:hypothetical protein
MEALTRLVAESLARYGLDRPVDYRRLQWSRWFRCESLHSLLTVPSKPGVFALAEDVLSPADTSVTPGPRMLAVLQFGEDDDMAFVLDRMLSRENPMRARLLSGRCFVRFVVIEDEAQRRSICQALNQWLVNSGEKASGIGAHFASSLELNVARAPSPANSGQSNDSLQAQLDLKIVAGPEAPTPSVPHLDSGAASNTHCPQPFPSGF